MTVGRLERAKKVFFIALGIDIAATVFVVASSYWIVGVLNGISAGALPRGPTIVERIDLLESFSRVLFLTMVGVGWTLFRWLDACYAHVRGTLNVRGLQHEKWKIWGWVLPFFNLFKPYQMLSELYKAGGTGAWGG